MTEISINKCDFDPQWKLIWSATENLVESKYRTTNQGGVMFGHVLGQTSRVRVRNLQIKSADSSAKSPNLKSTM